MCRVDYFTIRVHIHKQGWQHYPVDPSLDTCTCDDHTNSTLQDSIAGRPGGSVGNLETF